MNNTVRLGGVDVRVRSPNSQDPQVNALDLRMVRGWHKKAAKHLALCDQNGSFSVKKILPSTLYGRGNDDGWVKESEVRRAYFVPNAAMDLFYKLVSRARQG